MSLTRRRLSSCSPVRGWIELKYVVESAISILRSGDEQCQAHEDLGPVGLEDLDDAARRAPQLRLSLHLGAA